MGARLIAPGFAFWLVIPAEAGIQLFFFSSFPRALSGNPVTLLSWFRSKGFHSPFGRAGHFLVNSDKKVTKETPPREPRPSRCALRVRE
ncbi:MAG: hypothetical protein IJI03_11060, partial [Rudaea sp.]|nr:hypothetical protein [Rudaea sp.]